MKPEGRSLEFAVVGLGQAGGNLATEFFRRGYPALAINTAQTDLSALEPGGVYPSLPAERRLYIGMDGYDGAGMDPDYAAECIEKNSAWIQETILRETEGVDVVILAAGLGGGTGSAIASLVENLREHELPLVGLMTLPTDAESGIVKVNAVRAINEVVDAPLHGWIFVDNARISQVNQDVSVVDYFAHVNGRIASPIDGLNRLNEREDLRPIRSFDGEDLRKLMLAGGVLSYDVVELSRLSIDEVLTAFRKLSQESELMPSGADIESSTYVGLVIEGSEDALAHVPISAFEEIDRRLKEQTRGAAVYPGIYRSSNASQKPLVRLIVSSQSLPSRIQELLAAAQREGALLRDKLQEQLPTLELGDFEGFEAFRPAARVRSERPSKNRQTEPPIELLQKEIIQPRRPAAATPAAPKKSKRNVRGRPHRSVSAILRDVREHRASAPPPQPREEVTDLDAEPKRRSVPARNKAWEAALPVSSSSVGVDHATPEAETKEVDLAEEIEREGRTGDFPFAFDVDEEETPGPEVYDHLISEYLGAVNDEQRIDIARRLEVDATSEQTLTRYYAVEAMCRLGADLFEAALESAAEDPDDAIRALARQALGE